MSDDNEIIDHEEPVMDDENHGQEPAPEQKAKGPFSDVKSSSFTTVSMDEVAAELSQEEKQDYSSTGESSAAPEEKNTDGPKVSNNKSAERIAKAGDRGIAFLLSWIADDEDSGIYRAKQKEIEEISEELAAGFEEMGMEVKMPWWIGLAMVALIAYGDKFKLAFRRRKENKAKKKPSTNQNHNHNHSAASPTGPVIQDAIVIEELNKCEHCGNSTKNKRFCSKSCSAKHNAASGKVGRKSH